jgi:HD superfamily phosphohydrolase
LRTTKRIRTVLYGDQELSAAEVEVLHTPAMQRLYSLRQLGLTDRVYIDASHSRIHHVVGVLHQVDNIVNAVVKNLKNNQGKLRLTLPSGKTKTMPAAELAPYVDDRRSVIRFIGLLHDLTHAPFGHTLEDEIRLVGSKHDEPKRQAEAFLRLLCQLTAWLCLEANGPEQLPKEIGAFLSQAASPSSDDANTVGSTARNLISNLTDTKAALCLRLTAEYVAKLFADLGYAMTALLYLELLHAKGPTRKNLPDHTEYPFQTVVRVALENTPFEGLLEEFDPHKDAFMLDMVGNTVCADLLDYAGRDSPFAGLRLDYDPARIAENFTLVSDIQRDQPSDQMDWDHEGPGEPGDTGELKNPFAGWNIRTAMSLVSHKYRTDVPSELMNLLNVRFYLYERVIFHSTKCAADAMLGTALQLLGWREMGHDPEKALPKHLEYVGDDVFLHDIVSSLDLLIAEMAKLSGGAKACELAGKIAGMDRAHNGLLPRLLKLHWEQTREEALSELNAAKLLFNRLQSRRYFRPVFRADPSTKDADNRRKAANSLAELFSGPDKRYGAERRIEQGARLPLGTISIHCPKRHTAQKLANVYLTKPAQDKGQIDPFERLNKIADLDRETFSRHQEAVKAVEDMYDSMWRLTVYVAPEHMERWPAISEVAATVISEIVADSQSIECGESHIKNDPHLVREIELKASEKPRSAEADTELTPFARNFAGAVDELLRTGRVGTIPSEYYDPENGLSERGMSWLEGVLSPGQDADRQMTPRSMRPKSASRTKEILGIVRTKWTVKVTDRQAFEQEFAADLNVLPDEAYGELLSGVNSMVTKTDELVGRGVKHKGHHFSEFKEGFLDLLNKVRGVKTRLF